MFSYWDALRGERAAPERGEIDPGAIRNILADTFILELEADRSAQIRLAGTRLCALFGGELKGRAFGTLWGDRYAPDVRRYLDVIREDTAGLVLGLEGTTGSGMVLELEMLLLPLRHRGKPHARILGSMAPVSIPSWIGLEALTSVRTVSSRVLSPFDRKRLPVAARPDPEPARRFVVYQGGRA